MQLKISQKISLKIADEEFFNASKTMKSNKLNNCQTKKFNNKVNHTKINNSIKIIAEKCSKVNNENAKSITSDYLGVTALVAIMEPEIESQMFSRKKLPL